MARFVTTRLLVSALLLWMVATLTFAAVHVAPGDPTTRFLDPRADPARLAEIRSLHGFDQGLATQYGRWLLNCLRGDLGPSFSYQRPASEVVRIHLPATLVLSGTSMLLATLVGMAVGIGGARRPGSRLDRWSRALGLVLYATPTFWLGLMLILGLAGGLVRWFPPGGMLSPVAPADADPFSLRHLPELVHHLTLPATVLAVPLGVHLARLVRFGVAGELDRDYIRAGRSLGLSESRLLGMALRNSLGPVIQLLGVWLPVLVGGAVVVEQVFSWPGLGTVAVNALSARDTPLVVTITLLTAAAVVVGNLLVDVAHALLDPRVAA